MNTKMTAMMDSMNPEAKQESMLKMMPKMMENENARKYMPEMMMIFMPHCLESVLPFMEENNKEEFIEKMNLILNIN